MLELDILLTQREALGVFRSVDATRILAESDASERRDTELKTAAASLADGATQQNHLDVVAKARLEKLTAKSRVEANGRKAAYEHAWQRVIAAKGVTKDELTVVSLGHLLETPKDRPPFPLQRRSDVDWGESRLFETANQAEELAGQFGDLIIKLEANRLRRNTLRAAVALVIVGVLTAVVLAYWGWGYSWLVLPLFLVVMLYFGTSVSRDLSFDRRSDLPDEFWYCDECEARVSENDTVCSYCGADLEDGLATTDDEEEWYCDECGEEVSGDAKVCPHCGAELEDAEKIEDVDDEWLCDECGHRVSEEDVICTYCGTELEGIETGWSRQLDEQWIESNLPLLLDRAAAAYRRMGRGALVADITVLEPLLTPDGHWYLTREKVREIGDSELQQMIDEYHVQDELVLVLIKPEGEVVNHLVPAAPPS